MKNGIDAIDFLPKAKPFLDSFEMEKGNMFTDSWAEIMSQFLITVEREKLVWIVDNLMFSAINPIGAVTAEDTITVIGFKL